MTSSETRVLTAIVIEWAWARSFTQDPEILALVVAQAADGATRCGPVRFSPEKVRVAEAWWREHGEPNGVKRLFSTVK
jgi:hypothetical protein